jgi:hypothetical protein
VPGYPETAPKGGIALRRKWVSSTDIFTKLQVADRAQAIIRAREAGLGTKGDLP